MTTPASDTPQPEPTPDPTRPTASAPADAAPGDAVPAEAVADAVAAGDLASVTPAPADAVPADSVPAVADDSPTDAVPATDLAEGDSATVVLAAAPASAEGDSATVVLGAATAAEPAASEAAPAVVLAKAAAVADSVPTVPAQATGPDPRVPAPVVAQTPQPAPGVPAQAYPPPGFGQPYPPQQPAPGGVVWAVPAAVRKERKPRPWLRTVGRWVTAAAVATVVGVVSAVLVTQPARTDIPGLKTPADGRYTFPALSLPTLPPAPAGLPTPGAGIHQVDLRELLLPAPVGAKADSALPGRNGWVPAGSFIGLLSSPTLLKATFDDEGLRHIAATGWTMPDGTHTAIYLQQFRSAIGATAVDSVESTAGDLAVAVGPMPDSSVTLLNTLDASTVRRAAAQGGKPSVLYGYFTVGDTEVLVVMSNPKAVPTVDFEQVADLQDRLLSAS